MPKPILLKVLIMISLIGYPFLVYFGLNHIDVRFIALMLLVALVIRAILLPAQYRYRIWGMIMIGVVIAGLTSFFNDPIYLRLYPVCMSSLMLCIFAYSLYSPPSVIEIFARISFKGAALPHHVIHYTRNVTKVWCGFLALNALIALWSVFQSLEIWTLYNGFISYMLMGALLGGEFVYRQLVVKKRASKANV